MFSNLWKQTVHSSVPLWTPSLPWCRHKDDFYYLFILPAPGRIFSSLYLKLSRCQYFLTSFLRLNLISHKQKTNCAHISEYQPLEVSHSQEKVLMVHIHWLNPCCFPLPLIAVFPNFCGFFVPWSVCLFYQLELRWSISSRVWFLCLFFFFPLHLSILNSCEQMELFFKHSCRVFPHRHISTHSGKLAGWPG